MPKGIYPANRINEIRKAKVKQAMLQGKPYTQALREGGYTEGSAHKSSVMPVVKVCKAEIEAEFKLSNVTVENVLKRLDYIEELALKKGDFATATRCEELKGKYLAMFTDKVKNEGGNITQIVIKLPPEENNADRISMHRKLKESVS